MVIRPQSFLMLLVLAAAAGCVTPASPTTSPSVSRSDARAFEPVTAQPPDFDFSTLINPDHGAHTNALLHPQGAGLVRTGVAELQSLMPLGTSGTITQIDVHDGWAVVAGNRESPGFILVDIHDPAHPKAVGWAPSNADGWTARFSKDGAYVFYGCQPGQNPKGVNCHDPSQVQPGQTESGVSVWDVRDHAHPKFVDFIASASHNVQTAFIDGVDYVVTEKVEIIKFDRQAGKLTKVAEVPGRHDATIARHPVTGDWLLYTGTQELAIYNIDNPADPQVVLEAGEWKDGRGWHEQTPFPTLVDGRALLALGSETGEGTGAAQPLDPVTIVDITDPGHPVKLGEWRPPFQPKLPWSDYIFSIHEMAATPQGQLAIGWYHAGVWVIDVSTKERQAHPVLVASYQPNDPVSGQYIPYADTVQPYVPYVWGAAWDQRGYLVVPDMFTGVHVLTPAWGLHAMLDGGE